MNPHYNQNYTREEIDAILSKIKSCVEKGHYIISQNENRQENIDFINEYNIRSDQQKTFYCRLPLMISVIPFKTPNLALSMKYFMSLCRRCSFSMLMVKKK